MSDCPECGHENQQRASFCQRCGSRLEGNSFTWGAEPGKSTSRSRKTKPPEKVSWSTQPTDFDFQDDPELPESKPFKKLSIFICLFIIGFLLFLAANGAFSHLKLPVSLAEKLKNEPPSQVLFEALQTSSRFELDNAVSELSPDRAVAWQVFFKDHAAEHWAKRKTAGYCEDARKFHKLNLWPDELEKIISACDEIDQAEKDFDAANEPYRLATSNNHRKEERLRKAERELSNARANLAREDRGLLAVTVWIHGSIGEDSYEVSEVVGGGFGGERYVLRATKTVFKTTGRASLSVRDAGRTNVTLKNGRTVEYAVFEEADTTMRALYVTAVINTHQEVQSARAALKSADTAKPANRAPFDARIEQATALIQSLVAHNSLSPPDNQKDVAVNSKTQNLEQGGLFTETTDKTLQRAMFEKLCQGTISTDSADGKLVCNRCPKDAWGEQGLLKVERAYAGAVADGNDPVGVLVFTGCAGGWNFQNSAAAFERKSNGWNLVKFDKNINASDCQIIRRGKKSRLLCTDMNSGQGTSEHFVTEVWPENLEGGFFTVYHNTKGSCHFYDDFSQTHDLSVVEDLDGDGTENLALLFSIKYGAYVIGDRESSEDECEDIEIGHVLVSERKEARLFKLAGDKWIPMTVDAKNISHAVVRSYMNDAPFPVDVTAAINEFATFVDGSELAWKAMQGRLSALQNAQKVDELRRETARLAALYPEHHETLYLELAETCENAHEFSCARDAYDILLADKPALRTRGRAAWFFATAPLPDRSIHRANVLITDARAKKESNAYLAIAEAEISVQRNDFQAAQKQLTTFLSKNRSPLASEYLAALKSGTATDRATPRDRVPVLAHKIPRVWQRLPIPTGAQITPEERVYALEYEAVERRKKKDYGTALSLYFAALSNTSVPEMQTVLRLGIGKVLEDQNRHVDALKLYNAMHKLEPRNPDVLNRLAWFLLTTPQTTLQNFALGQQLAEQAAAITNQEDPSILDTLAEAFIKQGNKERARGILTRCVELDPTRSYYQTRLDKL